MAALAETRDVGSHLPLPPSIRRMCCIGDSLTYGQGVAPRQTLSTHVARFANMVYLDQLIWVDNLGQSSGNIWHSWVPFARLAETVRFDAAIFSLCQNDSQIFESNSVRYDKTGPWLKDGRLTPVLQRTFEELKRVAARDGTVLIVDFYSLWDNDAPLIEGVAQECARLGLPFVDLLKFLKQESGLAVAEFVASPFDGHPSDSGHRVSARRLVEELRELWTPPAAAEGMLSDRLVAAWDEAVQAGWAPDDMTQWALLVLEGKEIAARRRRSRPEAAAIGDLAKARTAIERRYRDWYERRAKSSQQRALYDDRDSLATTLEGAYATLRNLDEMVFVLESFRGGGISAGLWPLIRDAGYYTQENRLQDLPVDLRRRFLGMSRELGDVPDDISGSPLVPQFTQLRLGLQHNLKRLAALLPDVLDSGIADPDLEQLWKVAQNLVNTTRFYLTQFEKSVAPRLLRTAAPAQFTTVDVRIERDKHRPKRHGVFNLTAEIDYVEPVRARRRYKLWAGAGEEAYIYRFEMPLLLFGDVGVGVPAWDDLHRLFLDGELRLAQIEISNQGRGPSTVQWKPPSGTAPLHWVKFDRLLVPA